MNNYNRGMLDANINSDFKQMASDAKSTKIINELTKNLISMRKQYQVLLQDRNEWQTSL